MKIAHSDRKESLVLVLPRGQTSHTMSDMLVPVAGWRSRYELDPAREAAGAYPTPHLMPFDHQEHVFNHGDG